MKKVLGFEEEIHSLNSAKKYKNGELIQMQSISNAESGIHKGTKAFGWEIFQSMMPFKFYYFKRMDFKIECKRFARTISECQPKYCYSIFR